MAKSSSTDARITTPTSFFRSSRKDSTHTQVSVFVHRAMRKRYSYGRRVRCKVSLPSKAVAGRDDGRFRSEGLAAIHVPRRHSLHGLRQQILWLEPPPEVDFATTSTCQQAAVTNPTKALVPSPSKHSHSYASRLLRRDFKSGASSQIEGHKWFGSGLRIRSDHRLSLKALPNDALKNRRSFLQDTSISNGPILTEKSGGLLSSLSR